MKKILGRQDYWEWEKKYISCQINKSFKIPNAEKDSYKQSANEFILKQSIELNEND